MNRRFIPTRVHGALDYIHGAALLAAPELLRTKDEPRATLVSRLAGGGATAYTMMTDFELGIVKAMSMRAHLALDALSGTLLAGAPWLLGYAKGGPRYWLPHAFVGVADVLVAMTTKTEPSYYKVKPESVSIFQSLLKAKREPGRPGSSGGAYGGAVGLAAGGLGAGALILFLLRRIRGDAKERKRTVREFVRRLEEQPTGQKEKSISKETGPKSGDASGGPAFTSEEPTQLREDGGSEAAAGQQTEHLGERNLASGQVAVVGVLAKMGEAFEQTGGGQFILSSEEEGNFDLRGKESELDEIYQRQIHARVVGKIVDEDSQPRKMEVDEVEPA
jgi:hypothetical protein